MTTDRYYLARASGARLLRGLPGWTLSAKGTSLYRRIAGAHVSVYTKPGKGGTFYAKLEVPIEAINEADAAG